MKMFKTAAMVIGLSALSGAAQAAFLIEPHLGYNVSSSGDSTSSSGIKSEYDYSSAQYGLKAGGQYLGFMAGLDYTLSGPEIEIKNSTTTNDEFDKKELGVFIGYNLPILFRAWVGYYFDVTAEDSSNGGRYLSGTELSGTATELGVGFTGLPFLSLNLMYRNVKFDESKISGVTTKLSGAAEIGIHEFVVGISLPLTL